MSEVYNPDEATIDALLANLKKSLMDYRAMGASVTVQRKAHLNPIRWSDWSPISDYEYTGESLMFHFGPGGACYAVKLNRDERDD